MFFLLLFWLIFQGFPLEIYVPHTHTLPLSHSPTTYPLKSDSQNFPLRDPTCQRLFNPQLVKKIFTRHFFFTRQFFLFSDPQLVNSACHVVPVGVDSTLACLTKLA